MLVLCNVCGVIWERKKKRLTLYLFDSFLRLTFAYFSNTSSSCHVNVSKSVMPLTNHSTLLNNWINFTNNTMFDLLENLQGLRLLFPIQNSEFDTVVFSSPDSVKPPQICGYCDKSKSSLFAQYISATNQFKGPYGVKIKHDKHTKKETLHYCGEIKRSNKKLHSLLLLKCNK